MRTPCLSLGCQHPNVCQGATYPHGKSNVEDRGNSRIHVKAEVCDVASPAKPEKVPSRQTFTASTRFSWSPIPRREGLFLDTYSGSLPTLCVAGLPQIAVVMLKRNVLYPKASPECLLQHHMKTIASHQPTVVGLIQLDSKPALPLK